MFEPELQLCFKIAHQLKDAFPNDIMKITPNTIIYYSTKNNRLLRGNRKRSNMGGCLAYFTTATPHRIVIKQKFLKKKRCWKTRLAKEPWVPVYGNFAFVELMCHEMAHHRTSGHAKGFKIKYLRLMSHMAQLLISGEFYKQLYTENGLVKT